jgi:hypothetical protein
MVLLKEQSYLLKKGAEALAEESSNHKVSISSEAPLNNGHIGHNTNNDLEKTETNTICKKDWASSSNYIQKGNYRDYAKIQRKIFATAH